MSSCRRCASSQLIQAVDGIGRAYGICTSCGSRYGSTATAQFSNLADNQFDRQFRKQWDARVTAGAR